LTNMKKQPLRASDVYSVLVQIPEGKVTTYGDIAGALRHPKSSRRIGMILNKNPNPIEVPCHRVIMSDGKIGGYALGKERKKELLKKEGLCFVGDRIIDIEKCRIVLKRLH
jgi:methylated-DNA-[protein]-cysteine S-methyltransferase